MRGAILVLVALAVASCGAHRTGAPADPAHAPASRTAAAPHDAQVDWLFDWWTSMDHWIAARRSHPTD